MRRPIQGDDSVLEEWTHPDTSLGWGGMNSAPSFKADPVTFEEVECLHPSGLDTPVGFARALLLDSRVF